MADLAPVDFAAGQALGEPVESAVDDAAGVADGVLGDEAAGLGVVVAVAVVEQAGAVVFAAGEGVGLEVVLPAVVGVPFGS